MGKTKPYYKQQHPVSPWREERVFEAYEMAKDGLTDTEIARALDVDVRTYANWRRKFSVFNLAIEFAREYPRNAEGSLAPFKSFIFDKLPEHLQDLWDNINFCEEKPNAIERIEALFEEHGKKARQHLFLYAFFSSNFNKAFALRKCQMDLTTLQYWIEHEPGFGELCDQIHTHKKLFYEDGLLELCRRGNVPAILFANRTFNKDLGYGAKIEVQHTGQINHAHAVVNLDTLNLPVETMRAILEAIEEQNAPKQIIDAAATLVDFDEDEDEEGAAEDE